MSHIKLLLVYLLDYVYMAITRDLNKGDLEVNKICNDNNANKHIPYVYLTLSPIAEVSWLGEITQRHLVLNWNWKSQDKEIYKKYSTRDNLSALHGDWVGLFSYNVSNSSRRGVQIHGKGR